MRGRAADADGMIAAVAGPEKSIERKIVAALRSHGCVVVKMHGSSYSGAGHPDLIGSIPPTGRALAIEVKAPGRENTATALQRRALDAWSVAGAAAGIASSVDDALRIVGIDG